MARVLASIKVFPSEADVDLDMLKGKIEKSLPQYASVYKFDEEPVAFGLKVLIAHILLPEEKSGAMDEVETVLQNLDEVGEIQTQMVRRV